MKINLFSKKHFSLVLILLIVSGSFLFGHYVKAYDSDWVTWIAIGAGSVISWIIVALSSLLIVLINGLIWICGYNDFINSPAVTNGWRIVRDLCNMFFILILLVIAFTTILRIPSYEWKKLLPKLLIMAVLINFSKTICGLIIDFAQVIMLTFVNGFQAIGRGNLTEMLGLTKIMAIKQSSVMEDAADATNVFGAYVFALIYVLISIVVIVVIIAVLVMRMVMLWVYIVLSPLAYLLAAFPAGQTYASRWWKEFTDNVIVGPVLAFFIWLSFVSASSGLIKTGELSNIESIVITEAGSSNHVIKFIISIGMLIGGLMVTQQIGGIAGNIAGKGMAAIQAGKKFALSELGKATGVSYVHGVAKNYIANRDKAFQEKTQLGAQKFAGMVGGAKELVASPLKWAGRKIKENTWGRRGKEAEDLREQIKTDKDTLANFRNKDDVKNKKKFKAGDSEYEYMGDTWWEKNSKIRSGASTTLTEEELEKKITGVSDSDIKAKSEKAEELEKKQQTVDKVMKIGSMVTGGIIGGMVTGGLGFVPGLLGAAAGAFGPNGVVEGVKNAGKTDLNIASNYNSKQIQDNRDKQKLESEDRINDLAEKATDPFEKMAAMIEQLSRKLLTVDEAKRARDYIQEKTGGKNKQDGSWKDKRVGGQVEQILEKNYTTLTKKFADLESDNPVVKETAKRKLSQEYKNGTRTIKEMDKASIVKTIDQMAIGLKTKTFVNQVKDLPDAKKSAIIKALEKSTSYEAKAKLAFITNIKKAFGDGQPAADGSEKQKFTQSLTVEQVNEIMTKGDFNQRSGLTGAIGQNRANLPLVLQGENNTLTIREKNLRDTLMGVKREKAAKGGAEGDDKILNWLKKKTLM